MPSTRQAGGSLHAVLLDIRRLQRRWLCLYAACLSLFRAYLRFRRRRYICFVRIILQTWAVLYRLGWLTFMTSDVIPPTNWAFASRLTCILAAQHVSAPFPALYGMYALFGAGMVTFGIRQRSLAPFLGPTWFYARRTRGLPATWFKNARRSGVRCVLAFVSAITPLNSFISAPLPATSAPDGVRGA